MRKAYKLLAVAMALVLCAGLQSCQNTEQIPHGYPILFRCADITRAEATITDLQNNGFDVYAYFTANGSEFGFTKSLSYDADSKIWGYTDIEYWLPGATYYFKAVYPNGVGEIDNTTSAQSLTIENFDVTTQTDLLVAQTGAIDVDASLGSPTGGSIVYLQFKHLLANVVIGIKAEISGVEVQSISLEGISQTGNYNNGSWSAEQTTTLLKENIGITIDSDNTEFTDVTNGGFLTIPQNINGSQKLIIKTSFKNYDITIPDIPWESGKRYIYTLEIKQENIIFNEPSVVKWDSDSATGSVIIQ